MLTYSILCLIVFDDSLSLNSLSFIYIYVRMKDLPVNVAADWRIAGRSKYKSMVELSIVLNYNHL